MSVCKRLSRNEHGEPVLTITVEGAHDVYRLARGMERLQVEFCAVGRRILASLDRQHPGLVTDMTRRMGPSDPGNALWRQYR